MAQKQPISNNVRITSLGCPVQRGGCCCRLNGCYSHFSSRRQKWKRYVCEAANSNQIWNKYKNHAKILVPDYTRPSISFRKWLICQPDKYNFYLMWSTDRHFPNRDMASWKKTLFAKYLSRDTRLSSNLFRNVLTLFSQDATCGFRLIWSEFVRWM